MKKRRVILTVAVVGVVLGVIGTVGAIAWQQTTPPQTDDNKPSRQPSSPAPTPAPQTPAQQTVKLSLPNAEAIEARIEDYNDPSSLWVVVNKDRPLSNEQYRPDDLVLVNESRTDKSQDERSLRSVVMNDFTTLLTDARSAGYDLIVGSGFRSYELQATYYNNYVARDGEAAANKYSAKPGYSEHQTGLAVDVTARSFKCYLEICFGDMPEGAWLRANAAKYGFIVRYPADKTAITQYQYEPWHLRYVGKPLAQALQQSGLTLDEAYPYLQKTRTELIDTKQLTVP